MNSTTILLDGELVNITEEDVIVTSVPKKGWAVASKDGITVALDFNLTPDLIAEGEERERFHNERESSKEEFLRR